MLFSFPFIHPNYYLPEHLELTIRKLHGPEDRHAQKADGDDGEARSARACYFGGTLPLCCC
jgi:hypothetical protein